MEKKLLDRLEKEKKAAEEVEGAQIRSQSVRFTTARRMPRAMRLFDTKQGLNVGG